MTECSTYCIDICLFITSFWHIATVLFDVSMLPMSLVTPTRGNSVTSQCGGE